jgi:hypothetical protein
LWNFRGEVHSFGNENSILSPVGKMEMKIGTKQYKIQLEKEFWLGFRSRKTAL